MWLYGRVHRAVSVAVLYVLVMMSVRVGFIVDVRHEDDSTFIPFIHRVAE
jgi:hypothetical protein